VRRYRWCGGENGDWGGGGGGGGEWPYMLFVALFGPLTCMLGDQPFRVLETTDVVWLFGDKAGLVQSESLWRDVGSSVPLFAYWLLVLRLHCFSCRVCGGLHKVCWL
jgi:hypothetical protein